MPEIISFILSFSIEQLKTFNYIRQSIQACVSHNYNDPELFHVWIVMASLASAANISVNEILILDPLAYLFDKIRTFFQKINKVGENIPADDLLPILIELLPSLDKIKADELCNRLEILYDIREAEYGPDDIGYAITSLNIAMLAKQEQMKETAKDEKQEDQRILNIVKKILQSDKKDSNGKKVTEIIDVVNQLFQQICSSVEYISCYQLIYPTYCNALSIFIKSEISKNPELASIYFKKNKQQNYLDQVLKDLLDPEAKIHQFNENISLFTALLNYRYIMLMLDNEPQPKQKPPLKNGISSSSKKFIYRLPFFHKVFLAEKKEVPKPRKLPSIMMRKLNAS